ncbi:MAG: UvrD-helicase domain-containing protein [Deltaproteobacteria bacterium]|nr:UvrD-helicase domain-containing protein [Deltaproteobacteria bacterium]
MHLNDLNPTQKEAVTFGDGPLLILAGAGSGKTRVLTSRIAFLVMERGIRPENSLAVTFTNKAAGEMRERLASLMGDKASALWLGTFHGVGLRLLRREASVSGISPNLTVYDDNDQLSLIKQVMEELAMNEKSLAPKAVAARINQAKNEDIGPAEYLLRSGDFFSERVAKVYPLYQKRLKEMDAMDFGDLICEPMRLLKNNPRLLEKYLDRFRYILVDEYQDTNRAQYRLTKLLSSGTRNLLAVGDPDQSIYAWRGADIGNILDFERDYPDAAIFKLEQNYRSTRQILSAANSVIEKNMKRMKKNLWTENHEGSPVQFEEAEDEYREAELVIKRLRGLMAGKAIGYGDIAIFYRTNAQSRVFEERLIREGIPYAIVGGVKFYDRKEIKDAIAYLKSIANPNDALSLLRIINTPPRRIGKATFDRIIAISRDKGITPHHALKEAFEDGTLNKTNAREFINAASAFRKDLGGLSLHELTLRLMEDSGYMRMLQAEGTEEAYERIENLFEFVSAVKDFEAANQGANLQDFLDHIALISDIDLYKDKADRLTLMTLHSAKGLEFKAVFIVGMEEGLFPHSRSAEDPEELEEERRLCYGGMTRAKEHLYLMSAGRRTVYGEERTQARSRFIDEIAPEFIATAEPEYDREARSFSAFTATSCGEVRYTGDDSQIAPYSFDGAPQSEWRIGMKVKHPLFGVGVIKERSGQGDNAKLTVSFKDAGIKKLAVKYAGLMAMG